MTIGVVACGYADGYPRHAPTGTPVLVNGKRTRIVGRVSMDMISVDISDMPEAYIGTPVTLWGEGLSADEVGAAAGTLSYELLCKLDRRACPVVEVPVKKPKTAYVCSECGATALQWFGSCPSCGAAGTLSETIAERGVRGSGRSPPRDGGAGRSPAQGPRAHPDRDRRARPRARRRAGGGAGGAARRRPGHRQVDAASAGLDQHGRHESAALRDGRGIGGAGGAARAAAQRSKPAACASPPRRSSSACSARSRRRGRAWR